MSMGHQLGSNMMSNPNYVPPPPPPPKKGGKGRSMKTAGRRRRSSRRNSLSSMLGKPLKMLMGKKTRKHRSRR
jgi:hypothetical protein